MTRKYFPAFVVLLACGLGSIAGYVSYEAQSPSAPLQSQQVAQFNSGYRDGMLDACQQGSAYACQWLVTTR